MKVELIFKVVLPDDWKAAEASRVYEGSAHDKADGFLHFSTALQLAETLKRYYAGQTVVIVAVDTAKLGENLRYEHSKSRNDDFPHLYGALDLSAVCSTLYTSTHPLWQGSFMQEWLDILASEDIK